MDEDEEEVHEEYSLSTRSRLILFISGAILIPVGLYLLFFNASSPPTYEVTLGTYLQILGMLLLLFGIGLIVSFKDYRKYRKF